MTDSCRQRHPGFAVGGFVHFKSITKESKLSVFCSTEKRPGESSVSMRRVILDRKMVRKVIIKVRLF